ncbi:hypothetical protein PBRA_006923 [Plasmodiophora brassicae]|uniref:Uncharacterized protein n=1 Tax=Plasmodiophora brassicae TaxID=37360 RepID=A0A0G4ITY9_PLABS|nr:hypothetical protein PBRA_006923 [Plasmodiophora brassicae]
MPERLALFIRRLFALNENGNFDSTIKPGRSLYVPTFILEMIVALYILFGWQSLTASSQISGVVQAGGSTFSGQMIAILFVQIMFIVGDRVCYLYRSIISKLVLHYCQVILYTVLLFFYWPRREQYGFSSNTALVFFFFLKAAGWWLGCIQIRFGYPTYELHHRALFSRASKLRYSIYQVYRVIPFVAELEVLLGWMTTDTSLDLFETFKLEDIYANLYNIKGQLIWKREHRRGEPFDRITKFTNGTLLFIALLFVILVPLLLFSSANPVNVQNNVSSGTLTVSLAVANIGTFPLMQTSELKLSGIQHSDLQRLPDVNPAYVQTVTVGTTSDSTWTISPPKKSLLAGQLTSADSAVFIQIALSLVHEDSSASDVSLQSKRDDPLSLEDRTKLAQMVLGGTNGNITLPDGQNFIPRYIQLISVQSSVPTRDESQPPYNLTLSLVAGASSYWELANGHNGITFTTISSPTSTGLIAAVISMSITTIYISIVLAVGRVLRSIVQNQVYAIMYTDLHDVTDLMLLCEGIFVARKQREFELEEALYRSLIRLFRSPDSLIQCTRRREKLKVD